MAIRNGQQYIEDLKQQPRDVYVCGERVTDVAQHPFFEASIQAVAHLYDMQFSARYQDTLTYVEPETGERAGIAFMPPKSQADLRRKREAYLTWARATFGLLGRSPDFLNSVVFAFAESSSYFGQGKTDFAANIENYYRHIRDKDLFLTHVLVPPQNDRSKTSSQQNGCHSMHLRVVKETDAGIYVSGARMLATLGPIVDEVFSYNTAGLKAGDEDHAIAFALPIGTQGIRQICREPYRTSHPNTSRFDHPLASRFEESDALMIFDNAFVPWERVFIYRNVELSNALAANTSLRQHVAHQAVSRALVKMQMAVGVSTAVARSTGVDQFLHVQTMLGDTMTSIDLLKSALARAEFEHQPSVGNNVRPLVDPLRTMQMVMPDAYSKAIQVMQKVGAGGLTMMPTEMDIRNPDLRDDIETYYTGANVESVDRIRLFKLAWDLCGETFGSRSEHYERHYIGDHVRNLANNYLGYDKSEIDSLVKDALALE